MAHTAADMEEVSYPEKAPPLTFAELQRANRERDAHWAAGGVKIPVLFSAVELGGEVGELLNAIKKAERYKMGLAGGISPGISGLHIREELADVAICCSIVANKLGVDLGQAVRDKFNVTSKKYGFADRL